MNRLFFSNVTARLQSRIQLSATIPGKCASHPYKSTGTERRRQYNSSTTLKQDPPSAPPLLLYQTASPDVYVSSAAIDHAHESINPKQSLFTETKLPDSFQKSLFRYISPTEFNFELPDEPIPEVAFLGRSNVGKSSLLNALTTKHLAKTSKTPGRTQQVNYFGLYPTKTTKEQSIDKAIGYIIDLPGYGYAKAPDDAVARWQENTQDFLEQRISLGNLQRIYLLIDSRRGLGSIDTSILGWLDEAGCDYTIVMTKADSVGKAKVVKVANEVCMRYHAQRLGKVDHGVDTDGHQGPFVHVTSCKKNRGIVDLMWAIDADFHSGHHVLKQLSIDRQDVRNGRWGKHD